MSFLRRRLRWIIGALGTAVFLLILAGLWIYFLRPHYLALFIPPGLPEKADIKRAVWLDQNWPDRERYWFHHVSQGTSTIPMSYDWFVSLEAPEIGLFSDPPLLSDPEYLARFGFITSPTNWDRDSYGYRREPPQSGQGGAYSSQDKGYMGSDYVHANPDGLPVGFARLSMQEQNQAPAAASEVNFVASEASDTASKLKKPVEDRLGFTCAACHTGHFTYQGTEVRIDGGAAMVNLDKFRSAMGVALVLTDKIPGRLERFAERLAKRQNVKFTDAFKQEIKTRIGEAFTRVNAAKKLEQDIENERCQQANGNPTCKDADEGFGRLDALNRIGNQVFYSDLINVQQPEQSIKDNRAAKNAPVSFPHIWTTPWFLWAQYDGSIQQPLIRNAGEALGVSALVNLKDPHKPADQLLPDQPLYTSTVAFDGLVNMENALKGEDPFDGFDRGFKGLKAPKWPSDLFPQQEEWKIDPVKAEKGKQLYGELCVKCHMEPMSDPAFWASKHWQAVGEWGDEKYLAMPEIPLSKIGTDPARADVLYTRPVNMPAHLQVDPYQLLQGCGVPVDALAKLNIAPGVQQQTLFALALMAVVDKTTDAWMEQTGKTAEQRQAIRGSRKNCPNAHFLEALLAGGEQGEQMLRYRTRPLDGVWATAPFLHNGSVPNLWSLLSPMDERPNSFCVGKPEFDPVKVGYDTGIVNGQPVCDKRKWSKALDFRKKTTEFDVTQPGNSNAGHVFDGDGKNKVKGVIGRRLSEEERWELIEFLKTL